VRSEYGIAETDNKLITVIIAGRTISSTDTNLSTTLLSLGVTDVMMRKQNIVFAFTIKDLSIERVLQIMRNIKRELSGIERGLERKPISPEAANRMEQELIIIYGITTDFTGRLRGEELI